MSFKDKLNDLKDLLYGKSSSAFDDSINQITNEVLNKQHVSTTTIIELLQKTLQLEEDQKSKSTGKQITSPEDILKKTHEIIRAELDKKTVSLPTGRAALYSKIDEVYNYNPEVAQAISIYIDNILSPDIFTKNSIDIVPKVKTIVDNISLNQIIKLCYNIKHKFNLEKRIFSIVSDFIKYGDSFVEIRNPKEELLLYNILKENVELITKVEVKSLMETDVFAQFDKNDEEYFAFAVPQEILTEKEDTTTKKSSEEELQKEVDTFKPKKTSDVLDKKFDYIDRENNKNKYALDDLRLKVHSPKSVIALYSDDFIIGYLVIEKKSSITQVNAGYKESEVGAELTKKIIDRILKNIRKLLKVDNIKDDSESLSLIQHLLLLQRQKLGKVTTRFVPPDRMVHFKLEPSQFQEYGQSILQPILFTGGLLTALRLALVIYRLARAPEKRVFNIESSVNQDVATMIEQVRSEFDRREVTVDKLGTVDSISSIVSSFESIYLPMVEGRKVVEMDVISGGQLADKVEDANFILKELLSGLGIPPALLGFERQEEAKSSLSQQNIMFARTIVSLQKQVSSYLTELFLKVLKIINNESYTYAVQTVNVVLKPPRALMLNALSDMADEVQKLAGVFKELNLPVDQFVQFYLGDIVDSEWIKMYNFKETLDKEVSGGGEEGEEGNEETGGF